MYTALKLLSAILVLTGLSFAPLHSIAEDAGTSGFAFAKIVYSARAIAMGQALTGQDRNPDGVHFNPAAIIRIPGNEISTTYCNYFLDAQGGQIQYMYPKDKFTAWGLSMRYMNMGSIERTEVNQNGDLVVTGETFGAQNLSMGVTLAKYLSDALDAGGTLKVVYDGLDDTSATAVMLDAGIIHHPANENVKVGLTVRNLGFQTSYYTSSRYKEKLPTTFAAGISYRFTPNIFSSVELDKATGENFNAKLGIEYGLTPEFMLRGGFRSNAADWRNGGSMAWTSGLSLGAGLNWRNYRMDYGVSSYGDLGLVNQLTLTYEF